MAVLPPGVHEDYPADRDSLTPLFRQYLAIKDGQPQGILFYRLGDFYEMFGPDAVRASEILGLTLTARNASKDYRVAMAGIPYHASVKYIRRLVDNGEVVAICEQTEDPALAKGLVERAVTRVITAGTLVEDEYLSEDSDNYLVVLLRRGKQLGIAVLDSATGSVDLHELDNDERSLRTAVDLVLRLRPSELLLQEELIADSALTTQLRNGGGSGSPAIQRCPELPGDSDVNYFVEHLFSAASLQAYGLAGRNAACTALYALVRYLRETYRSEDLRLTPRFVPLGNNLHIDARTAEHLDLLGSSGNAGEAASGGLYGLLNHCRTSAGRRELKRRLLSPHARARQVSASHDSIDILLDNPALATQLSERLSLVVDIERIVQRASLGRSNPRELRALADSLPALGGLAVLLGGSEDPLLIRLGELIGEFGELHGYLDNMLSEEPPVKLSDGNVIRSGSDERVDELRSLLGGGEQWFADYEDEQRQRTGIRTLKVKQTNAFGYFIEVSKANLALVPADYTRRQTLVNAERFVTDELAEREADVRGAQGRLEARERELYDEILAALLAEADRLAVAARASAALDVQLALATSAKRYRWVRPVLATEDDNEQRLELEGARHPLVEQLTGERYYTKNDCWLDSTEQQIMLITGPNMGGKSTYMRMVATLCLLNQLGSYVPASRALLPVLTRIHTRVGAQDAQASGQSTFMVEMLETAEILNTAGPKSLVLLDEVGRGTSTYDGISIAKAVLEHLHEMPERPLTLFATHFFELTDLELVLTRLKNFQVLVRRDEGSFVFLYKVAAGAASDSFGIEVASLAGLPDGVVSRAREILGELEETRRESRERARKALQLGLFQRE